MCAPKRRLSFQIPVAVLLVIAPFTAADETEATGKIQPELLTAMTATPPGLVAEGEAVQHRIVVTLKPPQGLMPSATDYTTTEGLAVVQSRVGLMQEAVLSRRLSGSYRMLNRYQTVFGFSAVADEAAIRALAEQPGVERIEVMPIYFKTSTQSHPLANVGAVHAGGFTGAGVTIAIIDDGIDPDHPAFGGFSAFPNAKVVGGHDFGDNDPDPTIDCMGQSHGTAVAGVAAGNGGGILGTAPDARLVMLKVQSAMNCGQPSLDGDLVAAIDWAVSHRQEFGIRVLSMSLGAGGFSTVSSCEGSGVALRDAVNAAVAAGIVVLAASGNDGLCSRISRPACIGNAISVGAVYDASLGFRGICVRSDSCIDVFNSGCPTTNNRACIDDTTRADQVTCYSNSSGFLDILAPSDCATTAAPGGATDPCFNGTSSATPFAAGVAATLIQARRDLDNAAMRAALTANGRPIRDTKSGITTPRIDAGVTLEALRPFQPITPECSPNALEENFEGGLGDWAADGFWHLVSDSPCTDSSAASPPNAVYYGQDGGCNYDDGNANSGTLTSPQISGITSQSVLTFDHFRQVEDFDGGSFDRTTVEVVTGAGGTTVFSLDSTDPSMAGWNPSGEISLAAFAGQTIRLRYRFDTVDDQFNQFVGWSIDNVVVTGGACP